MKKLSEAEKTNLLVDIADILFPDGDIDHQWGSNTTGDLASAVLKYLQDRYILTTGEYSQHFKDTVTGKAVPLRLVLDMLNGKE